MFARNPSLALCALGLLVQPLALGQQTSSILPNNLPACAQTCPILQQAIGSCNANPQAAATCFCQSTLLTQIKTNNVNICAPQCADADFGSISSWYKQYCANPANPGGGQTTSTTTGTPTKATTIASTPPNEAAAATSTEASYLESDDINRPESGSQWWSNHWEWVLMVIILVVAFTAIGVGGTIWHKKRKRRREGWDNPRPEMSAWAPSHHSVHDFGNSGNQQGAPPAAAGVAPVPPAHGRGKGKERADVSAAQPPLPPQSPPPGAGRKLRKVLGRG